jgi:hypothetical protein
VLDLSIYISRPGGLFGTFSYSSIEPHFQDRTVSRLTEMQSIEYLLAHAELHAPCNLLALQQAKGRLDAERAATAAA